VLAGTTIPLAGRAPVALAQADGAGPRLDAVFVPPGRCLYVRSTNLYLIADTGVRYEMPDAEAAAALGLSHQPVAAPWPVVKLLAEGPGLSKESALVAHDGMSVDSSGVPLAEAGDTSAPR
jgi:hypothetical protein